MRSNPLACYGHCYICGRSTRHELCHDCLGTFQTGGMSLPSEWFRFKEPPEECDLDEEHCPYVIKFRAWSRSFA